MISTPKFEQLPVEALIMTGLGYAAGKILQVDAPLTAAIFAISTLANHILFQAADLLLRPFLKKVFKPYMEIKAKHIYTGTCATVSIISFLAAQQLGLLTRRLAGVCIFLSCAALLARLHIISKP